MGHPYEILEAVATIARILDLAQRTAGELRELAAACNVTDPLHRQALATARQILRNPRLGARPLDELRQILGRFYRLATWSDPEPCAEPLYQAIPEPRRYPLAVSGPHPATEILDSDR